MAISSEGGEAPLLRILSKEMVVPSKPTHRQCYFLSCFDIFWKDVHYNQRVLFYESNGFSGQEHGQAVMDTLKRSLARCLVHYYPCCGRLSPGQRLSIDCNDAGVEFVEASISLPISLLSHQGFQIKPFFEYLCQKVDHSGDCLYSSPLLSVQATLFSDGGLALGITVSHVVADGQSLWNFMVSWGECARGLRLSVPPVLDRERLVVPSPSPEKGTWDINTKIRDEDLQVEEDDTLMQMNGDGVGTHPSLKCNNGAAEAVSAGTRPSVVRDARSHATGDDERVPCLLTLSANAVKNLKEQGGGVHTSYEVTGAHFWQRLTAARRRPPREPTFFVVLANCRSRVKPPLPSAFFGNAIASGMTVSTCGKVRSESLHDTASRIHGAVVETTDSVASFMHWLEIHDHNFIGEVYPKIPKGNGISVSSSPWFPVYEVDFGWGKPTAVRDPQVQGQWEMVLFGGHPQSRRGDVEICTRLPKDVLTCLLEDPLFLGKALAYSWEDATT